jgi:hypothetical protein
MDMKKYRKQSIRGGKGGEEQGVERERERERIQRRGSNLPLPSLETNVTGQIWFEVDSKTETGHYSRMALEKKRKYGGRKTELDDSMWLLELTNWRLQR